MFFRARCDCSIAPESPQRSSGGPRVDRGTGIGDHVGGDAGLRQRDTDQAVARDDFDQLVFVPAFCALGPHGHHHEAVLLVGILYVDGDFVGQIEPELGEHLAWPTDHAPAVVGVRYHSGELPRIGRG